MAAVGCIFMAMALMREMPVGIDLLWLRQLMSIFTASKTEMHVFQLTLVYVICIFLKWCFSCSIFQSLLLVEHDSHPKCNGAQLFTQNTLTARSKGLIVEHIY